MIMVTHLLVLITVAVFGSAVGTLHNCHTEINQVIRVEPGSEIVLNCIHHNVSYFAMLSLVIGIPCEDGHIKEIYGPQDYADHVLYGQFNFVSNFSTSIKEKVACCNFTEYDLEIYQTNHQLFNCTLILPLSVGEDADSEGAPSKMLVIGVVVIGIVLILLILLALGLIPLHRCRRKTSVKRDDSDDSNQLVSVQSKSMPCSNGVQQCNETDSHTNHVYVYFGSDKKELACMRINYGTGFQFETLQKSIEGDEVNDIIPICPFTIMSQLVNHQVSNMIYVMVFKPLIDDPSPWTNHAITDERQEEGVLETSENVECFAKASDISTQSLDWYIYESEQAAILEKIVPELQILPTCDDTDVGMYVEKTKSEYYFCRNLISNCGPTPSYSNQKILNSQVFDNGHPDVHISEIIVDEASMNCKPSHRQHNVYTSCFDANGILSVQKSTKASIKEPYKESYKHGHELTELMISAALILLAVANMQIQLQNNVDTQNSYETN